MVSARRWSSRIWTQPRSTQRPSAARTRPDVTPTGPVTELTIIAKNIKWNTDTLTAPAGSTVKLNIDNQDNAIPHNFSLYASEQAALSGEKPLTTTKIQSGPLQESVVFNAPAAGTYFFRCDVHPTAMTGTFVVQ